MIMVVGFIKGVMIDGSWIYKGTVVVMIVW